MTILKSSNYVDKAEEVVNKLKLDKKKKSKTFLLTTSQIRNLLSLTSTLYDESNIKTFDDLEDKISYLRVQFVYQAGREDSVRDFVRKAQILDILKEVEKKKDIDYLQLFCRYMEALVAYFKFEGGKDQ